MSKFKLKSYTTTISTDRSIMELEKPRKNSQITRTENLRDERNIDRDDMKPNENEEWEEEDDEE